MAEGNDPSIITIKAQLIDEVTPKAEEMSNNIGVNFGQIAGQVQQFSDALQNLEINVPGLDETVSVLQQLSEGTLTVGSGLSAMGSIAQETGNAYFALSVQAAESIAEVMGITEEGLGGLTEYFTEFKDNAAQNSLEFASAVVDIGSAFVQQARSQVEEQRKADIEKVKSSSKSEEDKQKEIEKINAKAEAEDKKLAQREKALAIGKAVINTALAVANALTSQPFLPMGPIMAGVAAALGTAQIAIIASQQFAQGGIVTGASFTGDQIPVRVNSGEMILNRAQQSQLFAMANGIGGGNAISMGGDTIVINGNADQNAIDQIRKSRQEQMQEMKDLLKEMKYHGQLE
jgi:hypothetical protein